MIRYAIWRILLLFPVLLAVLTITFFMARLAPGSPFTSPKALPAEVEAKLKAKYGLDQPTYIQYARFLGRLAGFTYHGESRTYSFRPFPDFGDSTKYKGRSVNVIIAEALPVSAVLGGAAYLLALLLGMGCGILAAVRSNTWIERTISTITMLGVSIPSLVLGPVLVTIFSLKLHWLPPARLEWWWESELLRIPTPSSLILPAFTLAATYISFIARLTQSGLRDTLRKDYVRTARAKGLPEFRVVMVHGLLGALPPIVSFTGPALAALVTGTVVVEEIFAIPGLGHYFVDAASNRDYFLILGITAFSAVTLMISNLIVDISYALIDPRIIHDGGGR